MSDVRAIGELALRLPKLTEEVTPGRATGVEQGASFSNFLMDAVASANTKQVDATAAAEAFASGARDDIHGTMIAVKEAEIELKLVSNVRNKLVEAWTDLWRMSI